MSNRQNEDLIYHEDIKQSKGTIVYLAHSGHSKLLAAQPTGNDDDDSYAIEHGSVIPEKVSGVAWIAR